MADQFLHGVEIAEVDDGSRPIETAASSIIGIVGTAPRADVSVFPINTPVVIANSQSLAAKLLTNPASAGDGTLPAALDEIFDQAGAVVVVIRVEEGETEAETLANVIGGVDAATGQYQGVHALLAAQSVVGVKPRILIAPGFTHQRTAGGLLTLSGAAGTGYTDGVYQLSVTGGGGGSGAAATATVVGGTVTVRTITTAGSGYTAPPQLALPPEAGEGNGATFVATIGTVGNAVVAELTSIADRLRAVIIADGPNSTDADALASATDFGSRRIYLVDPWVLKTDSTGATVASPGSAAAAGRVVRTDNEIGWWASPSNKPLNGIIGTSRAIDFSLGDPSSRANLLNAGNVATIVRQNGFLLWGNRTLSSDPKWKYLSVVRTADIIADSLQAAHLWAVDQGITKNYVTEVQEGVNAYLRDLKSRGAILGGSCWIDKDLNSSSAIQNGEVFWDFDFTPVYPGEHLTFRSHLVDNYISEIF